MKSRIKRRNEREDERIGGKRKGLRDASLKWGMVEEEKEKILEEKWV